MPLSVKDGMGAWVKDFQDSNAPQFKGKSDKERREMAIAAYLSAKRGDKNEATDKPPFDPDPPKPAAKNSDGSKTTAMSRAKQLAKKARDAQKNEAVTYHGNPNKDDDARNAARRKRLAKQDNKVKLKGFGPDAAKGNMGNPAARAALKPTNEISQDLKKRYTDKAKSDYGHQQFSADIAREMGAKDAEKYHRRKQRNRMAGITKATRESVELDENVIVKRAYEIMKPTKSMNHGIEALKKTMKIDHGTATNLAKQVMNKVKKGEFKEAVQVDELKKSTLGSYVKKAAQDAGAKAYSAAQKAMSNPDQSGKDYVKSIKRQKGIAKATDKLTNEAGTPERLAMIRKAGEKINKEKKKAERDAKRAMTKDKDLMGEAKLDELSPATHDRYQKAAHKSAVQGVAQMRMGTRTPKSMAANQKKRQAGIDTSKYLNRKQHGVKPTYEAKSFDQKFKDHLKFATSKSPAVQAYMKKRAADRDAMNKANDPNAAKKGYALSAVPPERAFKKARKKGMSASDASQAVGTASRNRGKKLPK